MAIKIQVDILQLFSQWVISTGEKSPKSYWGTFFYFHLKFWKVLMKPQLSINEFLQNQEKHTNEHLYSRFGYPKDTQMNQSNK